ncbi:MAG: hypothetical protein LBU11_07950 [Zoogloeaceae bacterium]|jgi:uncharacterized DUF497 family protein|nr:hypothetical protein [Zoogloeaceae bacterium]
MEIECDPVKNALNIKKHGISLAVARDMDWDDADVLPDTRSCTAKRAWRRPFRWGNVCFSSRLLIAGRIAAG